MLLDRKYMPRFKITISYNGQGFSGFQVQPRQVTIQSELEKAFKRILSENSRTTPSGRTDAGVHALAQIIHVDFESEKAIKALKNIPRVIISLNSVLPENIRVLKISRTTKNFHARKNAIEKTYLYKLVSSHTTNPLLSHCAWQMRQSLDLTTMKKATKHLIGKHDFSAFCAADATVKTKTREIYSIKFHTRKLSADLALLGEKYLTIEFTGSGFLKQMVRIMTGTLVAVGTGKIAPKDVKTILKNKDRTKAPKTAPAHGLYLKKVRYSKNK